jgi:hypothetical protein
MRTLLISLILAALTGLPAQLNAQGLHLVARNTRDSVVLRWAPARAIDWERGNRFGYKVERFTIDPQKKEKPVAVRIGPDTLRAWSLERMKVSFPAHHPYAPAVAQALYGATFMPAPGTTDPGTIAKADNDLQMRHTFALVFADLDAGMADALGLRWADHQVDPSAIYLYRVTALDPEHRDTALLAVNRRLGPDAIPAPPRPKADELERSVKLSWPMYKGERAFTAYWVERSADGEQWERLNTRPYMQADGGGGAARECVYTDTLAGYGHMHHYRVRGITTFGETSAPSEQVAAMGRDRTAPPNPVMQAVKDEGGKLVVHWEQPAGATDLKGFRVAKAPTSEGRFLPLHAGLLPPTARSFTDTSSYLLGENHYLVYAVDTAGNESASMGGYGFLVDSIAPAPPTGLTGTIDTNGVVTLRWNMGLEPDVMGYRVFMANAPDHEFTNLSPAPFADTTWTDTITLKTLTRHISFKVVAVDRNFNHSRMSAILTLAKPDIVPPVAPVFSGYEVTERAVLLKFVPSTSPDASAYTLFREHQQGGELRKIAEWPAAEGLNQFKDTTAEGPELYRYRLQVSDSAGNTRWSPIDVSVEVPRRKVRAALQGLDVRYDAQRKAMALAWAAPGRKVKHYVIYRSRNGGAPSAIGFATTDTVSYVDKELPGAGEYVYLLKAVFAEGDASPVVKSSAVQVR